MRAYYPATTPEIIHRGKSENIYRLDGIEKSILLSEELSKNSKIQVIQVESKDDDGIGKDLINQVHSEKVLQSYKTGQPEELANASGIMWQPKLYDFSIEQALVSKLVTQEASKNGFSVGITGGGHHAESNSGYGFCPVNTIAISALEARKLGHKVAVLDLDTHYSNGCIQILKDEENIKVYSLWNQRLEKWSFYDKGGNIWHERVEDVEDYFDKLEQLVSNMKDFSPDFIVYHLGMDILETDRMGGVKGMSKERMLEKEEVIKKLISKTLNSKLAIFFGGTYIDWSKGEKYAHEQREQSIETTAQIVRLFL